MLSVQFLVFRVVCSVLNVQCLCVVLWFFVWTMVFEFEVCSEVLSVQCAVWGVRCAVWGVRCAVYSVQCARAVCSVQCAVCTCSVQCSVCSVQC